MRLERGKKRDRKGVGIYGGGTFCGMGQGVKSISSTTSLPILSPVVFYSVIVGGEAESGRWREGACYKKRSREKGV